MRRGDELVERLIKIEDQLMSLDARLARIARILEDLVAAINTMRIVPCTPTFLDYKGEGYAPPDIDEDVGGTTE